MHPALIRIAAQLEEVIERLKEELGGEPFGLASSNWSYPNLTRDELIEEAQSIIELINDRGEMDLGASEERIEDYSRRIEYMREQTIPNIWGNAGLAVPAYLFTLRGLRRALVSVLPANDHAEAVRALKKLKTRLRSMEADLDSLEPRTASLSEMVGRIEDAHDAADQLPQDLASLLEGTRANRPTPCRCAK